MSTKNGENVAATGVCLQNTRSVTGRKRGDDSRRIVTDCRVVTTRHDIVTDCLDRHTGSHVAKRDSGSERQVVYT